MPELLRPQWPAAVLRHIGDDESSALGSPVRDRRIWVQSGH